MIAKSVANHQMFILNKLTPFVKKKKKLYDCTLQKIIISKIDVKMPYGKGSVDQQ